MRLFVSIDLPQAEQNKLAQWLPGLPELKKTAAEQLHLTLFFLGECSGQEKDEIIARLSGIPFEPFTMAIDGIGAFPDRKNPRVIWAGVDKTIKLMKLQERIQSAVSEYNPEAAGRSFIPHITLARIKGRFDSGRHPGLFQTEEFITVPVHHFSLKKSILRPEGSVHKVVRKFGTQG
jgi:RNA 2',3'-cyclic 3'-phosphodiesterase